MSWNVLSFTGERQRVAASTTVPVYWCDCPSGDFEPSVWREEETDQRRKQLCNCWMLLVRTGQGLEGEGRWNQRRVLAPHFLSPASEQALAGAVDYILMLSCEHHSENLVYGGNFSLVWGQIAWVLALRLTLLGGWLQVSYLTSQFLCLWNRNINRIPWKCPENWMR